MARRSDADIIREQVDRYRLEVNGVRFWAPYWVNNPDLMADTDAPHIKGAFKGKGTPGQLVQNLRRLVAAERPSLKTDDDYRRFMRSHGLGIDCSGFVYYALSGWLRARGRRPLAQQLVVSRDDVLAALRLRASWQRHGVTKAEVQGWPASVPLSQVCRRFHKDPRMLAGVAALVNPAVVNPVAVVEDIQPGDVVKFTHERWGDHIAVAVERKASELVWAESTEPTDELGGVRFTSIAISDVSKGLEDQAGWPRAASYHPGGASRDGMWRLKEVTG